MLFRFTLTYRLDATATAIDPAATDYEALSEKVVVEDSASHASCNF